MTGKNYLSFRVFCDFFKRIHNYLITLNKDCFVDVQHSKLVIKFISRFNKDVDIISLSKNFKLQPILARRCGKILFMLK